MVRSRSRSPKRVVEKRRSRSRDRDKERDRERRRHHRSRSRSPRRRSRSRSPRRRRSPTYKRRSSSKDNDVVITGTSQVSPSRIPKKTNKPSKAPKSDVSVPDAAMEGKSEEEIEMMKLMGFGGFNTTKGKQVPGADISASNVIQKRKYRQYMNRRGGFNRPLDFVA